MNLIKNRVNSWLVALVVTSSVAVSAKSADGDPDVKQDVRNVAAVKLLKARKDVSLLYVRGLVCPSCSIGIRVKVGKLPFVDSTRYKRGIELDTKTQLLTVALLPGVKADAKLLVKAIADAGYDPIEWYSLTSEKLESHPFAIAKKSK